MKKALRGEREKQEKGSGGVRDGLGYTLRGGKSMDATVHPTSGRQGRVAVQRACLAGWLVLGSAIQALHRADGVVVDGA